MKDGFWLNYRTDKAFVIDEHEMWLRRPGNAEKLGVPQKVIDGFSNFAIARDRNKFLIWVMQHAPIMRIRGHGAYTAFEYSSRSRSNPIDAIWIWGKKKLGPFSNMFIANFATNEKTNIRWGDFLDAVDSGGYEAVMRAASTETFEWGKVAAELLEMSKKLIEG